MREYMERCLMSTLYEWKDSKNRKPLILEGARQVGKTYLSRAFTNVPLYAIGIKRKTKN